MNERTKLLIIDDDQKLVEAMGLYLTRAGYQVFTAADGHEGLQKLDHHQPDLVILDIMMPNLSGWEVCERIREVSNVPVIMLTARGQEADRVKGLQMGADDYVTKPFSLRELEARIQAVLRRTTSSPSTEKAVIYSDENLTVNLAERKVMVRGKWVSLTPTEFRLLACLVENAGRVLTHNQLLERVWGWEYKDDLDYVRVYIWRLRRKVEKTPDEPEYILTEHGFGYSFRKTN